MYVHILRTPTRLHYHARLRARVKICHGVKQNAKICAIGETDCNET